MPKAKPPLGVLERARRIVDQAAALDKQADELIDAICEKYKPAGYPACAVRSDLTGPIHTTWRALDVVLHWAEQNAQNDKAA